MKREFHRTLLIAPSNGGKSTLLRSFVKSRNTGSEFIFVSDVHGIYSCEWRFNNSKELLAHFDKKFRPGIYCCTFGEEDWEYFFEIVDSISGLTDRKKNQNVTLILDEIIEFSTSAKNMKGFEEVIRYSRYPQIDLYLASMRPRGIHPLIPININRLIVFRQNRRIDLKAILETSSISDRDVLQIRKLKQFVWSRETPVPIRGTHFLVFPEDSLSDFSENLQENLPIV